MIFVFLLAWFAGRKSARSESFVSEYFLGGRALGLWAFCSYFCYNERFGWKLHGISCQNIHSWLGVSFMDSWLHDGAFHCHWNTGKRINYVARKSGSITLPEVLGKQLKSDAVTLTATGIIILFMFFYLLAQFKAGGMILITLLGEEPLSLKEGNSYNVKIYTRLA